MNSWPISAPARSLRWMSRRRCWSSARSRSRPKKLPEELPTQEAPQQPARRRRRGVGAGGGQHAHYLARCCNPMPPDEIVGFVTRGRGVAVHGGDCPNAAATRRHERVLRVAWGRQTLRRLLAGEDSHPGLRSGRAAERDHRRTSRKRSINLLDASAVTARKDNLALITATIEVRDAEQLSRVLARIERLPNVREVRRQKGLAAGLDAGQPHEKAAGRLPCGFFDWPSLGLTAPPGSAGPSPASSCDRSSRRHGDRSATCCRLRTSCS